MKLQPACFLVGFILLVNAVACSVGPTMAETNESEKPKHISETSVSSTSRSAIEINPGSPAETVRAFYQKLREGKIREAIFLTNLRPAIEALTDDELKEFAVDFEAVARSVPAEVEINGEIISGDTATVTAKLPDENNEKLELQQIRLRKVGEHWLIISADEEAEKKIRKEGKNYFLALRIETHQDEAKKMLDRIAKAQLVHSLQNEGRFAEIKTLVAMELLPPDISSSESTGYDYELELSSDRRSYSAFATPAAYGKSGRLSFALFLSKGGKPQLKSADNGGRPVSR